MRGIIMSVFSALLLTTGFSQASNFEIYNVSSCYAFFRVYASRDCGCRDDYYSNIYLLAPGGYLILNNSNMSILGGNFPAASQAYVHSVTMYSSRSCSNMYVTQRIGEAACGYPDMVSVPSQDIGCTVVCQQQVARWVAADNCYNGTAYLVITN